MAEIRPAEYQEQLIETIRQTTNLQKYICESLIASHERTRRWFITVILIICLTFGGIVGYGIHQWTQYDTVDYSYSQDGQGTNIIGEGNEVNNGTEAESSDTN